MNLVAGIAQLNLGRASLATTTVYEATECKRRMKPGLKKIYAVG
jgi:hypothetical protein